MQSDQNQDNTPENQNPSGQTVTTPQANSSTGSGMKVIQPISDNPAQSQTIPLQGTHSTGATLPNVTPTPSTDTQTMYVDGQPIAYTQSYAPTEAEKPRRHWFRIIGLTLSVLVVIGTGAVLATNQNIRATVFRQKFVAYNYPTCKTHICTVKFYRGSTITSYSPPPPPGETPLPPETVLTSPIIGGVAPISLRIVAGAITTQARQALAKESTCSTATSTVQGFSQYIPALDVTANFCGIYVTDKENGAQVVIAYYGAFITPKTNAFYNVFIEEHYEVNAQYQFTKPVFDLTSYQTDFQTIVASISVANK